MTRTLQTRQGIPIKATVIDIPGSAYGHVQVAMGHVWATQPNLLSPHKTLRIDAQSYSVEELSRSFTAGMADLLVDEYSLWHSDGRADGSIFMGKGDLYRVDPVTNQIMATIEGVGAPFASGDNAVWAYHPKTRVITGIDAKDNQIRTRIVTQGEAFDSYAFGAGSIWQFTYGGDVSRSRRAWQLAKQRSYGGTLPPATVRRIDPVSGKVIAEVAIGPYAATDQIRFAAGAIWVLGWRDGSGTAFATRIDVTTNRVAAVIPFPRSPQCKGHVRGRVVLGTPVIWHEGVWVSTGCSNIALLYGNGLQQIDLQTNSVTDEIGWVAGGGLAKLAAGEGALWAVFEGLAVRFDFQQNPS